MAVSQVEDQEARVDVLEVVARDAGVLLLPSCVPCQDLQLLGEALHLDFSPDEVDADGGLRPPLKHSVFEAHEE